MAVILFFNVDSHESLKIHIRTPTRFKERLPQNADDFTLQLFISSHFKVVNPFNDIISSV